MERSPLPPPPPPPMGRATPPSRGRRARRARTIALLALASMCGALAGAAAGYLAGDHGSDTSAGAPTTTVAVSTTVPTTTVAAGALSDDRLDVPAIVAKAGPSVVTIETTITTRVGLRTTTGTAAGTGIILTAGGLVLTNAHVIAGATSISVTLSGEQSGHDANVVLSDTAADVAVVQITGAVGLTPATFATARTVVVGEDVVAIGNALALEGGPTVTSGIVSGLGRSITTERASLTGLIQTDAAISSGDSGGPLLDRTGTVVGLTCAGASSGQSVIAENVGFAIPIGRVMAVLQQAAIVLG